MRDADIWRSAWLLREARGAAAWQHVAQQVDKAVAEGNPALADTWRRIAECLAEMESEAPHKIFIH
jgi:hypothetical protein